MLLFHNTTTDNASLILQEGFKKSECSDFGEAAYFSNDLDFCAEYGPATVCVDFKGRILDTSSPYQFEIFKRFNNENIVKAGFDGLKDGHIFAIYNTTKISNIRLIR